MPTAKVCTQLTSNNVLSFKKTKESSNESSILNTIHEKYSVHQPQIQPTFTDQPTSTKSSYSKITATISESNANANINQAIISILTNLLQEVLSGSTNVQDILPFQLKITSPRYSCIPTTNINGSTSSGKSKRVRPNGQNCTR